MIENVALTLPPQAPVAVYGSTQFDLPSKIAERIYRIFVFKPQIPPPPSGFPVVVVTDGNMTFPLMATVDATFALTGTAALVVGVGYATEDPTSLFGLRNRDLTPPTPLSSIEHRPGQPRVKLEDYGGSEFFYRFLTEELRPLIASLFRRPQQPNSLRPFDWRHVRPQCFAQPPGIVPQFRSLQSLDLLE
jgi:uncharacterized protein